MNTQQQHLFGKHVLITGASRGIGAAIADAFDRHGVKLSLLGRTETTLEEKCGTLNQGLPIVADVTQEQTLVDAFETARKHHGPIDILINNAGGAVAKPFLKTSWTHWQNEIQLNLTSVFLCTQLAISDMQKQNWGRVINIASTAGQKGYPYVSSYCAAKHGVIGFTRALAHEFAQSPITINAICPGYTDTDMVQQAIKQIANKTSRNKAQAEAELLKANPQGRLVQPQEVANTALWLCSEHSNTVHGQSISLAGGEVM